MVHNKGRVLRIKRSFDIRLELAYLKHTAMAKKEKAQNALYVVNPCHFITFKIDRENNLVANLLLHHDNCVRLKGGVTKTKIPLTDGADSGIVTGKQIGRAHV